MTALDPIALMAGAANRSTHPDMDEPWWRERMVVALEALTAAGFTVAEPQPARKNRARLLILSHMAQFSMVRRFSNGAVYGGLEDMAFSGDERSAQPGDLVALHAAPPSQWYLSWLIERDRPEGWCDDRYLLESIETGELCEWSNVGMAYYSRKMVAARPSWRWTDAQHEFNDLWKSTCAEERDAYIYLPVPAEFAQSGGVTLGTRTRHAFDDIKPTRHFPVWPSVTKDMMLAFYDEAVKIAEAETLAKRAKAAEAKG